MFGGTPSRAVAFFGTALSVVVASKHVKLKGLARNITRRRKWTSQRREKAGASHENAPAYDVPTGDAAESSGAAEIHPSSVQSTVQNDGSQVATSVFAEGQEDEQNTEPAGGLDRVAAPGVPRELPKSAAEQQKVRRKKYVRFRGEDENDYTKGPIRMVLAFDGIEKGAALLLNLDFSQKIQAALIARRTLQAAEQAAAAERWRWRQLISRIGGEIGNLELMIGVTRDQSVMSFSDEYLAKVEAGKEDVKKLEGFLSAVQQQYQLVDVQLQSKAEMLRDYHEDVDKYLEEAFVAARLMAHAAAESSAASEEFCFEAMYEQYCRNGFTLSEGESGAAGGTRNPAEALDKTDPNEQVRAKAEADFHDARRKLVEAQEAFDMRRGIDAHEQLNLGDEEPVQLEYSLRWVQRGRELTQALIKAEEEEHKARQAALDAGVVIADQYQSSNFRDHPDDGYRESYENNAIAQVPRKRITEWIARIPDSADPEEQELAMRPEIDNWSAGYVDIGDSRSLVGDSSQQKKIKGWAEICNRVGR
ncbi:unnamed protein product [Cercospora beticola]|nr:unnamed protein product [Cercospora beticola]